MRVLGFDPGVHNFAWALYNSDTLRVEASGMVSGHMAGARDWKFLDTCLTVVTDTNPDFVAMERFAFRMDASVESEPINQMIGKLDLLCRMRGLRVVMMLPAHWKNKFKIKTLPKGSQSIFDLPIVHQADAACIAKYAHEYDIQKAEEAVVAAQKAEAKRQRAAAASERRPARRSARAAVKPQPQASSPQVDPAPSE